MQQDVTILPATCCPRTAHRRCRRARIAPHPPCTPVAPPCCPPALPLQRPCMPPPPFLQALPALRARLGVASSAAAAASRGALLSLRSHLLPWAPAAVLAVVCTRAASAEAALGPCTAYSAPVWQALRPAHRRSQRRSCAGWLLCRAACCRCSVAHLAPPRVASGACEAWQVHVLGEGQPGWVAPPRPLHGGLWQARSSAGSPSQPGMASQIIIGCQSMLWYIWVVFQEGTGFLCRSKGIARIQDVLWNRVIPCALCHGCLPDYVS